MLHVEKEWCTSTILAEIPFGNITWDFSESTMVLKGAVLGPDEVIGIGGRTIGMIGNVKWFLNRRAISSYGYIFLIDEELDTWGPHIT